MKYFFELGYPFLVSTEIEYPNSYEVRVNYPIVKRIKSFYVRIWIGKKVLIVSTNNGFEIKNKPYRSFKFVFGIYSE